MPPSPITIFFGLTFSGPVMPTVPSDTLGQSFLDFHGLLSYLEHFYALPHDPANRDALRTEQYRQAIEAQLTVASPIPFYSESFAADKIATAEDLLSRRDELIEAGYPLHVSPPADTPARIRVLHELESLLLSDPDMELMPGTSDRLAALLADLRNRRHPPLRVYLHEPEKLIPPGPKRLIKALASAGDEVVQLPEPATPTANTDLGNWQRKLHGLLAGEADPTGVEVAADGSLLLLRAERETHLAAFLARMVKENPSWRPGVLLTTASQTLDTALIMEGLPSMGIPSTSLARPSLQVLKLVTAFLWEPMEVQRIMEFVSLVTKPLDRYLSRNLATHLADTPGLFGARWTFAVEQAFRDMEARNYSAKRVRRAREQYEFWFRRRRYPLDGVVPKGEVRGLFVFLRNWALDAHEEDKSQKSLLVLAAQSERATELLDVQPETELTYLDVERLVRTVYQPAPAHFSTAEMGALPVYFATASTAQMPQSGQPPMRQLIWWDFVEDDPQYFFSRYYPEELEFLRGRGCNIHTAEQQNQLVMWQNLRPTLHTREQLVLCVPRKVLGSQVEAHPLLGDLQAAFGDRLPAITVDIDAHGSARGGLTGLTMPTLAGVPINPLAGPMPHLALKKPQLLEARESETPTSMEDLLYYPHKWIFRHQLKLRGTPILTIAGENRLRGNLSHLFTEQLLAEIAVADHRYDRREVENWIDDNADRLLRQQGAVLLEYGQEPERVQFLRTIRKSTWNLVSFIQQNGWQVRGSELELDGTLSPTPKQAIRGRADLVLERSLPGGRRESCVVDLKWRGKTVFTNLLRNEGDIQLCLYAELLRQGGSENIHTAYYLLRDARMIGRNELAFNGATVVPVEEDHTVIQQRTLEKIAATHDWRRAQFLEGTVEVRCADTAPFLEDLYVDLDHDRLLEMKDEDGRFDDYRSLIGLVR